MFQKAIATLLSTMLILTGLTTTVSAAVMDTQSALSMDSRQAMISDINASLARQDVQQTMIDMGVDPLQAQSRVASLSDQELVELNQQIETLPAGGSALALIGAVFVVLLILELVGVINIFNKA